MACIDIMGIKVDPAHLIGVTPVYLQEKRVDGSIFVGKEIFFDLLFRSYSYRITTGPLIPPNYTTDYITQKILKYKEVQERVEVIVTRGEQE